MARQAAPAVVDAIKKASTKTGVDFAYLMEKASAESSFDARAESKTSSAAGLFQFIESTWMKMVKAHGHECGLGQYADCIDEDGKVSDPALKQQILDLRMDPEKSAMMAAKFAADNRAYLEQHLGADAQIGATEMYFAHFMGAGGATAFLKAMQDNPLADAAALFPKAARANRNVFYDSTTGQPRTLAGVYDFFAKKFGDGNGSTTAPVVTATAQMPTPPRKPAAMPVPSAAPYTPVIAQQIAQDMMMDSRSLLLGMLADDRRDEAVDDNNAPAPQSRLLYMAQLAAGQSAIKYNE